MQSMEQSVQIESLSCHPEWADLLAEWHVAEWYWLHLGWTPEIAAADLRRHSDPDHIPTTLVAVKGGEPVGSVSLLEQDLAGWEHLTPWLASLYVRSDCRGRGIGRQLVGQAVAEGRRMKVAELYLFTPAHREFYAALGWSTVTQAEVAGQTVIVMSLRLDRPGDD
jgi:predicted N-acetyltransferase YhbS